MAVAVGSKPYLAHRRQPLWPARIPAERGGYGRPAEPATRRPGHVDAWEGGRRAYTRVDHRLRGIVHVDLLTAAVSTCPLALPNVVQKGRTSRWHVAHVQRQGFIVPGYGSSGSAPAARMTAIA